MKIILAITISLLINSAFGQSPTSISGTIVDENNKPVANAIIYYGEPKNDTTYTDQLGRFKLNYPNPQRNWYYFYVERKDFLPKSVSGDFLSTDIVLNEPIELRSRKGCWNDPKQIDSTDIGITVREAIKKYKLDIDACLLWDEPPGKYYGFETEFADSSYVLFTIQGMFSIDKRLKMTDVLNQKITGFGISDTKGNERIIGNGFTHSNPYYVKRQMKLRSK